jgi:hypothetical protein
VFAVAVCCLSERALHAIREFLFRLIGEFPGLCSKKCPGMSVANLLLKIFRDMSTGRDDILDFRLPRGFHLVAVSHVIEPPVVEVCQL